LIKQRPKQGYANRAAVQETLNALVFGDIVGHPEEAKLVRWIQLGYLRGFDDATIRPNGHIDGNTFVEMANRALQLPEEEAFRAQDLLAKPNQSLSLEDGAVLTAKLLNLNTDIGVDELSKYNIVGN